MHDVRGGRHLHRHLRQQHALGRRARGLLAEVYAEAVTECVAAASKVMPQEPAPGVPTFGARLANEEDARTIRIRRPKGISYARFYAEIENLMVESDGPARVVVDERTGTVVIGNDVRISRVAISHGTLTVRITETPRVVQPEPFSRGETAIEPFTEIEADQPDANVALLDGPNLQTLVSGLNRLGVKPDGIIAILQGIKSAGALQAELVLQ